jgi:hypothetical protein
MPDPVPDLETAVEYLRKYGAQYSVEVLSERLRQQGIAPKVLAEAVFRYNEARLEAVRARPARPVWKVIGWTCGILVALAVVGVLVIGLCINYMGLPHN